MPNDRIKEAWEFILLVVLPALMTMLSAAALATALFWWIGGE